MTCITIYDENKRLVGASVRGDPLKKQFCECLKAFHRRNRNEKANMPRTSDVFFIWRLFEQFGVDVKEYLVQLGKRNEAFKVGILIPNSQACFCIRALSSATYINNNEADAILMRHQRTLLFEQSESFLSNFVNGLDFDEDDHVRGSNGPLLMNHLVEGNETKMLRLLLERNVNVSKYDENHLSPFHLACRNGNEEIVSMFIYYNAVANSSSLQDDNGVHKETPAILYAAEMGHENIIVMLIDYIYDQWNDFDVKVLVEMMLNENEFPLGFSENFSEKLARMASKCCSSAATLLWHPRCHTTFWEHLFDTRSLEEMLQYYSQSDDACNSLMDCFNSQFWECYWLPFGDWENIPSEFKYFFDNLTILANTTVCNEKAADKDKSKRTFLHAMMDKIHDEWPLRPAMVLFCIENNNLPVETIESIILLLLANNAPMDNVTFQLIYKLSCRVNTKLFEICRFQHVDCSQPMANWYFGNAHSYSVSSFYCDFPRCKTMMDVLGDPANQIGENDIAYFTSLSSHPAVKEKAYSMKQPKLTAKTNSLPKFPKLLEFARDATRKYVVEEYKIKTNWQFYEAVKTLEIPRHLQKMIAYDRNVPLYR